MVCEKKKLLNDISNGGAVVANPCELAFVALKQRASAVCCIGMPALRRTKCMAGERPILLVDDDDSLRAMLVEQLAVDGEFTARIGFEEQSYNTRRGKCEA